MMASATPSVSAAKVRCETKPTMARADKAAMVETLFMLKVSFLPASRNGAWLSDSFIRCQPSLFRASGASIKGGRVCNMAEEWWIGGVVVCRKKIWSKLVKISQNWSKLARNQCLLENRYRGLPREGTRPTTSGRPRALTRHYRRLLQASTKCCNHFPRRDDGA